MFGLKIWLKNLGLSLKMSIKGLRQNEQTYAMY